MLEDEARVGAFGVGSVTGLLGLAGWIWKERRVQKARRKGCSGGRRSEAGKGSIERSERKVRGEGREERESERGWRMRRRESERRGGREEGDEAEEQRGGKRRGEETERSKAKATKVYAVTLSQIFQTNTIPKTIIIQSSLVRRSAAEPQSCTQVFLRD